LLKNHEETKGNMRDSVIIVRLRSVAIAFFIFTSIFLIVPSYASAFSLSDIPLIGFMFTKPVSSNLSIKKQVALVGNDNFSDSLFDVAQDEAIVFKVTVTNNSSAIFNDIVVIESPSENISMSETKIDIARLNRNETKEILIEATTNARNISVSEQKCAMNIANLLYKDELATSDSAEVCITNKLDSFGKVLGVQSILGSNSPSTGIFDEIGFIAIPLLTFMAGLALYLISLILEFRLL